MHCIVVTGYGKSRHSWRSSDVQRAALEVLKNLELEAQVLPQSLGLVKLRGFQWIYLGKLYRPHCSPSLEIIVSKGNHPQMALIQVSEIL